MKGCGGGKSFDPSFSRASISSIFLLSSGSSGADGRRLAFEASGGGPKLIRVAWSLHASARSIVTRRMRTGSLFDRTSAASEMVRRLLHLSKMGPIVKSKISGAKLIKSDMLNFICIYLSPTLPFSGGASATYRARACWARIQLLIIILVPDSRRLKRVFTNPVQIAKSRKTFDWSRSAE